MTLPQAFIDSLRPHLSNAELDNLVEALTSMAAPTSIRLNPRLTAGHAPLFEGMMPVPWCPEGFYLPERPPFTLDPRLHAGAYYVQEASSMFIAHVLRSLVPADQPVAMLDLCAAPGGKSTAAIAALPEGSTLVANEVDRRRYAVLTENVAKWHWPEVSVTSLQARQWGSSGEQFDVILVDAPCSGEGMFRKDAGAVAEWSEHKVAECVATQRAIVRDVWPALRPGGLLVYSTCTFNVHEDEETLAYMVDEMGASPLVVPIEAEWGIGGPLVGTLPCYRFMPHRTRGEGLFMAAVRKGTDDWSHAESRCSRPSASLRRTGQATPLYSPDAPRVDVTLDTALDYLRRQAIVLPDDAPRGLVTICYDGYALGPAKNIGPRANNLYPKEWRIRNM